MPRTVGEQARAESVQDDEAHPLGRRQAEILALLSLRPGGMTTEQLGSEIILDLSVGGSPMVASVEPTVRVRHGEKIRLAINPTGLRFFDGGTEVAL